MQASRPDWDTYFMKIAYEVSTRSTCPARHVGAITVKDKRILTTGYNGAPPGQPHCTEVGCKIEVGTGRCTRTVHAEMNAIVQASRYGVALDQCTLYSTCRPCIACATAIAAGSGITKVVYAGNLATGDNAAILLDANIELVQYEYPLPDEKLNNQELVSVLKTILRDMEQQKSVEVEFKLLALVHNLTEAKKTEVAGNWS